MKQILRRQGSWLLTDNKRWQMMQFLGPFPGPDSHRQYFRVETTSSAWLLVSRHADEKKGLQTLHLEAILSRTLETTNAA